MKKLLNNLFAGAFIALVFLLAACERNSEPDLKQLGWEYYPLKKGLYFIYDVNRINYNFASENEELNYELKEVVDDYYLNQKNDTVYIVRRYQRSTPEASWKLDSAFQVQRTPQWVVQTSNNRPVVKLSFPIAEGRTWNANILNTAPADSFSIVAVGTPFETEFSTYASTLEILQEDILDKIVETDQRKEVYASGVGMVYKRINNIKYCSKTDCLGQEIINSGLFMELQLKETGIE